MPNRYQYIKIIRDEKGKRYYVNNFYPEISPTDQDLYLITTEGDRYDLLAAQYLGDKTLWWIIPSCNSLDCDSLFPPSNIQLRIPATTVPFLQEYTNLNK